MRTARRLFHESMGKSLALTPWALFRVSVKCLLKFRWWSSWMLRYFTDCTLNGSHLQGEGIKSIVTLCTALGLVTLTYDLGLISLLLSVVYASPEFCCFCLWVILFLLLLMDWYQYYKLMFQHYLWPYFFHFFPTFIRWTTVKNILHVCSTIHILSLIHI